MIRRVLIDGANPEETRVALEEDGCIVELSYDTKEREQIKGNVYIGFVTRVEPSLQAAFIDYGGGRQGFLPFAEIACEYHCGTREAKDPEGTAQHNKSRRRYKNIQGTISVGNRLVVQVLKEERRNKGATLTTYIGLSGRSCILMPNTPNEQLGEPFSVILKQGSVPSLVQGDYDRLWTMWANIIHEAEGAMTPTLLYEEGNAVKRALNDFFEDSKSEVIIEGASVYKVAMSHIKRLFSECTNRVQLHSKTVPLFSYYGIEEQIDNLYSNRVPLPSGGHMVIDITEALVSIDVNSGKMTRSTADVESTALKTNVEAVSEAARQLRLRNLSGIIIIDLISMSSCANRRIVETELRKAIVRDRAKINILKINELGLLEMSRQRIGVGFYELNAAVCTHCKGTGLVQSMQGVVKLFYRRLSRMLAESDDCRTIKATISCGLMSFMINSSAKLLMDTQAHGDSRLQYSISPALCAHEFLLEREGRGSESKTESITEPSNRSMLKILLEEFLLTGKDTDFTAHFS